MSEDRPEWNRIEDAAILRNILDHLPTSIFAKDESLRFIYSNEAHCRIIGQDEAALLGKSDADFYPPEEARDFLARDRAVIDDGETIEAEETATGSSGVSLPVLTRKTRLVTADGKRYLIGTNVDQRINNSVYQLSGIPDDKFSSHDDLYFSIFIINMATVSMGY